MEKSELHTSAWEWLSHISFETPRVTRFVDKVYAFFMVLAAFPIVMVLSLLIAGHVLRLPPPTAVAFAVVVMLFTVRVGWKWLTSRLRFCIAFYSDHLKIGRGFSQCLFAYEDIAVIRLTGGEPKITHHTPWVQGSLIRIRCGRRAAKVNLDPQQMGRCLMLLRHCCPNAILIDRAWQVHLPENPTRPELSQILLERHCRRWAWFFVGLIPFGACMCALLTWDLIQCAKGNLLLGVARLYGTCIAVNLIGAGTIIMPRLAWRCWRAAADVRTGRVREVIARQPWMRHGD